jgi:hypothetical protein
MDCPPDRGDAAPLAPAATRRVVRTLFAVARTFFAPGPVVGAVSGLGVATALVLASPIAEAKTSVESMYGFERTWNAALRLVRVDLGYKIAEKDDGAGYLLFEYTSPESGTKATSGSIELIRPREGGGPVQVIVQLPQMPRYHEMALADSLTRKMRSEYGDPPARAPKEPPKDTTPKDAGPDVWAQ